MKAKTSLLKSNGRYSAYQIVYYMYQYSSCFPVFYQVVRTSDKSVWVTPIGKMNYNYSPGGGSYKTEPSPGSIQGKTKRLSIRPDGYAYITYYGHLQRLDIWDGKPVDCFSD